MWAFSHTANDGPSGYTGNGASRFGMGGAVAVHALVVGVVLLVPAQVYAPFVPKVLIGHNIPMPQDPPPPPPPQTEDRDIPSPPKPLVFTPISSDRPVVLPPLVDPVLPGGGVLPDARDIARDPPRPDPVLVEAMPDPRFMRDFQPAYPPSMRRADMEGRVTIRVHIGADGRVRDVERLSATTDAFWEATRDQAMRKWRFRPATRDGAPVESVRTMIVHFQLKD